MNLLRYRSPTADEANRRFVVPLSKFLIVAGVMMALGSCFLPIHGPLPFVSSERLYRIVFVLIAIFLVADGIGLLFRNRMAWYAMLAYCCLNAVAPIFAAFDSRFTVQIGGYETLALGTAFNSILAVAMYLGTRPAFVREHAQSLP